MDDFTTDMQYIGFMKKNIIKPIKRLTLRDEVYNSLKNAIVTLDLKPEQRLNDQELAEEFGVSRTPVREALKRLEDEGLVESIPGSVTRVTPLNKEEAKHSFIVVATLHALAAKLAVPFLAEKEITELEKANEKLKEAIEHRHVLSAIEADERFHHIFLNSCGNPEILNALERIVPKVHRLEISQFSSLKGLNSVEQHRKIIQACMKRDSLLIAELVEQNWLSLGELLMEEKESGDI